MSKRYLIIGLSIIIILILIAVVVLKNFKPKEIKNTTEGPKATSSGQISRNEPVTISKIEDEKIKIEYYPEIKKIVVYIDAQSKEEYNEKVKKAVKLLQDSGFDTCDNNIFWPTPQNLKEKLGSDTFDLIHNLTCPQRTPPPKPATKSATGSTQ